MEANIGRGDSINSLPWSKAFEPLEARIQPTLSGSGGCSLPPSSQYINLGEHNMYVCVHHDLSEKPAQG